MERKDYFSGHSSLYATFRPTYPAALYDFIFSHLKNKSVAWDCATGNGQVAKYLASTFDQVLATDISQNQLDNATQQNNIVYSLSPAEKTNFKDHQFDLITVGQAMHWFKLDEFYEEVKRVGKKDSLLAVWVMLFVKSILQSTSYFYTSITMLLGHIGMRHVSSLKMNIEVFLFPLNKFSLLNFNLTLNGLLMNLLDTCQPGQQLKNILNPTVMILCLNLPNN